MMWKCNPNKGIPPKLAFGLWYFIIVIVTLPETDRPDHLVWREGTWERREDDTKSRVESGLAID